MDYIWFQQYRILEMGKPVIVKSRWKISGYREFAQSIEEGMNTVGAVKTNALGTPGQKLKGVHGKSVLYAHFSVNIKML